MIKTFLEHTFKMMNTAETTPDAIIVLANQMDANGVLNPESIARAEKAAEILSSKGIPYIVTCGWAYRKDTDIKIADAFKRYLVEELNIEPAKVITEVNSRDTVGDAYFTKTNLALPRAWRNLYVVTSNYHVERTREIFNFIYGSGFIIDVFGSNVSYDDTILSNEISSTDAFRKTFEGVEAGSDRQILIRLRESHPFYNGKIYNKI